MSAEVQIRDRTPADDDAIVSIRNEGAPNLPPTTVERYRFQADPANAPEGAVQVRRVAVRGNEVVGILFFGAGWTFARPHTMRISLGVRRSLWGQGTGSQLYEELLRLIDQYGVTRVYGYVVEGDEHSLVFARQRDFVGTGRVGRFSRLSVKDVKFDGYEAVEERLSERGIEIKLLREFVDDDRFLRKLHDAEHAVELDIPSSEAWTQTPFEIWRKWILESPVHSPDQFWVAVKGDEPIGLAALQRQDERTAFNGLTGTIREYRGIGLARALKKRQIEWARNNGIEYIFTSNDAENSRMLAINIRLGYKPVPGDVEVARNFD